MNNLHDTSTLMPMSFRRRAVRTPEIEADLFRLIEEGHPISHCVRAVGLPDGTLTRWAKKDPAFADRVNRAIAKGLDLNRRVAAAAYLASSQRVFALLPSRSSPPTPR